MSVADLGCCNGRKGAKKYEVMLSMGKDRKSRQGRPLSSEYRDLSSEMKTLSGSLRTPRATVEPVESVMVL
jgi:DNA-binding protein H-NS